MPGVACCILQLCTEELARGPGGWGVREVEWGTV
jgi:hypothetical protein